MYKKIHRFLESFYFSMEMSFFDSMVPQINSSALHTYTIWAFWTWPWTQPSMDIFYIIFYTILFHEAATNIPFNFFISKYIPIHLQNDTWKLIFSIVFNFFKEKVILYHFLLQMSFSVILFSWIILKLNLRRPFRQQLVSYSQNVWGHILK